MSQPHVPNPTLRLPWWLAYDRFVGLDIHKHYVTVGALDQQRELLFQRRRIPLEQWPAWVEQHLTPQDTVIMEATTNCWWVYDQTAPQVGRVCRCPSRQQSPSQDGPASCQTLG